MLQTKNIYPSRINSSTPSILDRKEPVVYSDTQPLPELTQEQVDFYRDNGFLWIESFFTQQEVETFSQEMNRLLVCQEIIESEKTITESESKLVRSIFWVHKLSPIFDKLSRHKRILNVVHYLLNDRVYIHQSRLNFKPSFSGTGFYWHSDFETWHVEDGMPAMRALSVMITLTENQEINGPLMLIPGSHKKFISCIGETPKENFKQSLKEQQYGLPAETILNQMIAENGIATLTGAPGSIVFFDCNTIHGSKNNLSPYPRSNLFFVYNSVQNSLQEPLYGLQPRPEFIAARKTIEIVSNRE
jgi:ectoine hydroxylase